MTDPNETAEPENRTDPAGRLDVLVMPFPQGLIEFMRHHSQAEHQYINPNFLLGITESLYDYYQIEDGEVDQWVHDMFRA